MLARIGFYELTAYWERVIIGYVVPSPASVCAGRAVFYFVHYETLSYLSSIMDFLEISILRGIGLIASSLP